MVAPNGGGDSETNQYMAVSAQLVAAKAQLNTLQSRLSSGSTDLSNDPSDPDLQLVSGLKGKLLASRELIEAAKGSVGANNPKMMAEQASVASVRKQLADATDKMRQHLKERIANTQDQITSLQAEAAQAQKALIAVQAQRERLNQLQHDVAFRADQLNARERASEQAKPDCLNLTHGWPPLYAESLSAFGTLMPGAEAIHPIKLNGVDPHVYLADALAKIVNGYLNSQIHDLLPWAYVKTEPLKAVA